MQDVRDGTPNLIALVEALRLKIWDCFGIEALRSAERLRARYGRAPMDFADATLVLAAEHHAIGNIATLDKRGFRTFRYGQNNRFRLLLTERHNLAQKPEPALAPSPFRLVDPPIN